MLGALERNWLSPVDTTQHTSIILPEDGGKSQMTKRRVSD